MGGRSLDRIVERLAGDRVDGQRHGDVAQLRRQLAVVFRRVEPQGLDEPQEGDLLLQLSLGLTELDDMGQEIGEEPSPSAACVFAAGKESICQSGKARSFMRSSRWIS